MDISTAYERLSSLVLAFYHGVISEHEFREHIKEFYSEKWSDDYCKKK